MDVANFSPSPRPEPLAVLLPDETTVVEIPPITVDQARRALLLDPDDGHQETAKEGIIRLHEQAKVLLGPSLEYLCDVWTIAQMREVIAAIYRAACGDDAETQARRQTATQTGRVPGAYDTLRRLEGVCIDLATALGKLPSEIGAMPLVSALALCHEHRLADAMTILPAQPPRHARQ